MTLSSILNRLLSLSSEELSSIQEEKKNGWFCDAWLPGEVVSK